MHFYFQPYALVYCGIPPRQWFCMRGYHKRLAVAINNINSIKFSTHQASSSPYRPCHKQLDDLKTSIFKTAAHLLSIIYLKSNHLLIWIAFKHFIFIISSVRTLKLWQWHRQKLLSMKRHDFCYCHSLLIIFCFSRIRSIRNELERYTLHFNVSTSINKVNL